MTAAGFYHCAVKAVGRSTGRSAVAAAAYRHAERLTDDRTGLVHDYRAKGGVMASFIVAPSDAPAWAQDRGELWNAAEAATTAKNGRIASELEVALPHELTADQRRELVEGFARDLADRYKVAVDVAIHGPGKGGDNRNHHAHILVTHRELGPEGFGAIANTRTIERMVKGQMKAVKTAGAFNEADIVPTRQAWAEAVNSAYAKAGLDIRTDHRSHADRGMIEEPTQHLGPSATAIERRGEASSRGDDNRAVASRNAARSRIEEERLSVKAAIADLLAERQAREDRRELRAAVRSASSERILAALTEKRATFTRADLLRTLRAGVEDRAEAGLLTTELLAHPDIVGLRETANDPVSRYTTRAVLADEMAVLADARALVRGGGKGLSDRQRNAALRSHTHLDEEQREAFEQATGRRGLSILAGEAGTGKSTTLAAIRDAYEGAGFRVVGMAWTNSVVQDLKADGFKDASTIASALGQLDRGREHWDARTVLVVDEAAMLSSRQLGRVLGMAKAAGSRVILAGDDRQLASIERGGLFSALQAEHGAAELHTVRRVGDAAQRQAFNHMHAGRFGEALSIFDQAGAICWTETQADARGALVAQWAADTKAAPDKSRFVFAYSNAEVAALNADLRAVMRERGVLGKDRRMQTDDGPADFATGDRVQFTGSAYGRAARAAGLVTGAVGVVRGIEGERMTVELDGKGGKPGRVVSFTVGADAEGGEFNAIRHGYAGTIYKGQGKTLDQSYLYHSQHWRASSAYVALSRHRESTALFVAREVTRGGEPWTLAKGGLEAMDDKQRRQAERAYEAWAEEKPAAAARHGLADYVAFVQDRQGERGRGAYDMEQLTRQISRADETRAASQFVPAGASDPAAAGSTGGLPRLSGPLRLSALQAFAAETARRMAADPLAGLLGRRGRVAGRYDVLRQAEAAVAPSPPAARGPYADLAQPSGAAGRQGDMDKLVPTQRKADVERQAKAEAERKARRRGLDGPDF